MPCESTNQNLRTHIDPWGPWPVLNLLKLNQLIREFKSLGSSSLFPSFPILWRSSVVQVSDYCIIFWSLHWPSFEEGFNQHSIFLSLAFSYSTKSLWLQTMWWGAQSKQQSKFQLCSLFQKNNTPQGYEAKWRNIIHSSYTDHYKHFESEKGHYKEVNNSKTFQSYISRHRKLEVIFSL